MIRNAVIHLLNEQPLWADLPNLPGPGDSGILCLNLRMANGAPPVFVRSAESRVWFPMAQVRFVELPPDSPVELPTEASVGFPADRLRDEPAPAEDEAVEVDEHLLRRIREL